MKFSGSTDLELKQLNKVKCFDADSWRYNKDEIPFQDREIGANLFGVLTVTMSTTDWDEVMDKVKEMQTTLYAESQWPKEKEAKNADLGTA